MKKLIAIILSIAMLIAILAGCNKDSEDTGDPSENTDSNVDIDSGHEETERADALTRANDILNQLRNYQGDDFEAFFTEMMYEYSDDYEAFEEFPNGYLFVDGDMMPEFYEAALALGVGEYSGLVETSYGYHIILRTQVDVDATPFMNAINGDYSTLRQVAASADYSSILETWTNALNPIFTNEYQSIDIMELLAVGDSPDNESAPDFDAVYETFPLDTPMIIIDDSIVTWEELFANIYAVYGSFSYYSEEAIDLNEPYDDEMTFGEAIMTIAQEEAVRLRSYLYGAKTIGFTVSAENASMFTDQMEGWKEEYGGEAGLLEAIWEQMGIKGFELFEFVITTNDLPYYMFAELYGDTGELFSHDAAHQYAEENGFVMAKHILFLTEDPAMQEDWPEDWEDYEDWEDWEWE